MFKRLLLMTLFMIFSVEAQVLSGHQEFVHYSSEQKETFIIKIMELMVELENKYETAPASKKEKYSVLLKQLRELMLSSAHAAETDLSSFANDLTTLLDPNVDNTKRCIYAGWVSTTVSGFDRKNGQREICQHPKFLKDKNSPEARAYAKSSSCGQQSRNTIACNPAIFGFKNQSQGSQFCVPAGPAHSENSSYACMQLALGTKTEAGADSSEKRIDYLKKQFEGSPSLVNNLYGFIYKTCLCDSQEKEVINQIYLNSTRPHRTCLGLVNTIAETNHCVEFNTVKSSEMELFREIRSFTSNLATQSSGSQVDTKYRELLNSLRTRFSTDYAQICGGGEAPPPQDSDEDKSNINSCNGECDLEDGKLVGCIFKDDEGNELEGISPPEDNSRSFSVKVNEEDYLCSVKERVIDHGVSCELKVSDKTVTFALSSEEAKLKSTHWTPERSGELVDSFTFANNEERVSLKVVFEFQGKDHEIECGSENNPNQGKTPRIELIPDGDDGKNQKFKTKVEPEEDGWEYQWSRTNSNPPKASQPETKIQGESDEKSDPPQDEGPKDDSNGKTILGHSGKTYDAPKEEKPYEVCVKLVRTNGTPSESNEDCKNVGALASENTNENVPTPRPGLGGPQLPQMPQPMRRGVDFSRGGVL